MNNNQINEIKIGSFTTLFNSLGTITGGLIFLLLCIFVFINGANTITKVAIIPFFIVAIAAVFKGISLLIRVINMMKTVKNIENNNLLNDINLEKIQKKLIKVDKFINNLFIFAFLILGFGILTVANYFAIKDWANGGSTKFFLSLILWIICVFILAMNFKKNK